MFLLTVFIENAQSFDVTALYKRAFLQSYDIINYADQFGCGEHRFGREPFFGVFGEETHSARNACNDRRGDKKERF